MTQKRSNAGLRQKQIGFRPTWAEIDLRNLRQNFFAISKLTKPGTKMMVTVKADAYGHGLVPVARTLEACGVNFLGVASLDEGIALRQAGIKIPVLILGLILRQDAPAVFDFRLTPTVCDYDVAVALNRHALRSGARLSVHVKVDTGMGRIGVLVRDALPLIRKIHALKGISIEGVFTHLASADANREFTLFQLKTFHRLIQDMRQAGIRIPIVHAANSMGCIGYKESHLTLVRPGLAVYGLYPKEGLPVKLRPVLSLKSRVMFVKRVPAGSGISYGHEYITKNETTIATLPIGYGDGYPRNLYNRAHVLIRGKRLPICGRICMDQTMVDVGDVRIKIGEEAVLIGSQGKEYIGASELARLAGTISYEIVCGLGNRIPRVYIYGKVSMR